ncbi:hypothetical protein Tco_0803048 [Tanacetum coccineum]|uniref:Uncharacterized protein n=1 Tax=Tanacetum coccineum TaxID=301880 RepID=A0ABQ5A1E8_9ASTR
MVYGFSRPISLIGKRYTRLWLKSLANRLVGVLGDLAMRLQSAFVATDKILDRLHHLLGTKIRGNMSRKKALERSGDKVLSPSSRCDLRANLYGETGIEQGCFWWSSNPLDNVVHEVRVLQVGVFMFADTSIEAGNRENTRSGIEEINLNSLAEIFSIDYSRVPCEDRYVGR